MGFPRAPPFENHCSTPMAACFLFKDKFPLHDFFSLAQLKTRPPAKASVKHFYHWLFLSPAH